MPFNQLSSFWSTYQMVIVLTHKDLSKTNSKKEVLSAKDEKRLNSSIPGVSRQQVSTILSVLHTNPDCRYGELKLKKLSTVMGYMPNRKTIADLNDNDDSEFIAYISYLSICLMQKII